MIQFHFLSSVLVRERLLLRFLQFTISNMKSQKGKFSLDKNWKSFGINCVLKFINWTFIQGGCALNSYWNMKRRRYMIDGRLYTCKLTWNLKYVPGRWIRHKFSIIWFYLVCRFETTFLLSVCPNKNFFRCQWPKEWEINSFRYELYCIGFNQISAFLSN